MCNPLRQLRYYRHPKRPKDIQNSNVRIYMNWAAMGDQAAYEQLKLVAAHPTLAGKEAGEALEFVRAFLEECGVTLEW